MEELLLVWRWGGDIIVATAAAAAEIFVFGRHHGFKQAQSEFGILEIMMTIGVVVRMVVAISTAVEGVRVGENVIHGGKYAVHGGRMVVSLGIDGGVCSCHCGCFRLI